MFDRKWISVFFTQMNERIQKSKQVKAIDSKISPKPATPSSARNPIPPTEQVSSVGGKVVWVYIAAPYIFVNGENSVLSKLAAC
jgi:hypothetical protein